MKKEILLIAVAFCGLFLFDYCFITCNTNKEIKKEETTGSQLKSTPKWIEENGIIYFTVTSSQMTSKEWFEHLGKKCLLTESAVYVLLSEELIPTSGKEYKVAILRGNPEHSAKGFRSFNQNVIKKIDNLEVFYLISDYLTNEDLNELGLLGLVVMYTQPLGSPGLPILVRKHNMLALYNSYTALNHLQDPNMGYVFLEVQ